MRPLSGLEAVLLTHKQRREIMVKEKNEKLDERDEQIVVLDEGIDVESMADPRGICCRGPLFAFRW